MGMSKTLKTIVSLALLMFLAFAATNVEAKVIDYRDLYRGDHSKMCDKAHPETCKKEVANPYRKGCELIKRCRGGG
ncbi:unnamed protein product [Cochlearia groenlandica]